MVPNSRTEGETTRVRKRTFGGDDKVFSLIGAALLRSGLSTDTALLKKSSLVVCAPEE